MEKVKGPAVWKKLGRNGATLIEIQNDGWSAECVLESNPSMHKWNGVAMVDKENLHPRVLSDRTDRKDDIVTDGQRIDGDDGDPIEAYEMCSEEGVEVQPTRVATVLRDLKHRHRLDVVVILEPRVSGIAADRIIKNWGFKLRREAEGFSGGIWILWNLEELVVDVILLDEQFIHCNLCFGVKKMAFTVVYASPNEARRHRIWDILYNISVESHDPWLLAGPKWNGLDRVYKRLDRCLCNVQWQENFENAVVKIIPRVGPDHHLIIVSLAMENKEFRGRPFRYEVAWQMHEQFDSVIMHHWSEEEEVQENLNILRQELVVSSLCEGVGFGGRRWCWSAGAVVDGSMEVGEGSQSGKKKQVFLSIDRKEYAGTHVNPDGVHRSGASAPEKKEVGILGPRMETCQRSGQADRGIVCCQKSVASQGGTEEGSILKVPVDLGRGKVFNEFTDEVSRAPQLAQLMYSDQISMNGLNADMVGLGPRENLALVASPNSLELQGPAKAIVETPYHVEFPAELENIGDSGKYQIGLSPISEVAVSLRSFHLKRQPEEDLGPAEVKRYRKLNFEAPFIIPKSYPGVAPPVRGRRKSYRSVKAAIRSRNNERQLARLESSLDSNNVPTSEWVPGRFNISEIQSSSVEQNAGGWIGPTTGAP
ncbi:hypothetical protein K1719_002930 [Acacia pycnantha]|nr:hypothetical protein K1719_002930 [Acacia pycnantha]